MREVDVYYKKYSSMHFISFKDCVCRILCYVAFSINYQNYTYSCMMDSKYKHMLSFYFIFFNIFKFENVKT